MIVQVEQFSCLDCTDYHYDHYLICTTVINGTKLKQTTQTKLERSKMEVQTFPLKLCAITKMFSQGGLRGLIIIIGCIFWFTGRWAYNPGGGGEWVGLISHCLLYFNAKNFTITLL